MANGLSIRTRALLAVALLGETLQGFHAVGILCIATGLFLATRR